MKVNTSYQFANVMKRLKDHSHRIDDMKEDLRFKISNTEAKLANFNSEAKSYSDQTINPVARNIKNIQNDVENIHNLLDKTHGTEKTIIDNLRFDVNHLSSEMGRLKDISKSEFTNIFGLFNEIIKLNACEVTIEVTPKHKQ